MPAVGRHAAVVTRGITVLTLVSCCPWHRAAAAGHDVWAVDLPGYGRSQGHVATAFRSEFLLALISNLRIKKPVLVAPSMSGWCTSAWSPAGPPRHLFGFTPLNALPPPALPSSPRSRYLRHPSRDVQRPQVFWVCSRGAGGGS